MRARSLLVAVALALTGCGSDIGADGSGPATTDVGVVPGPIDGAATRTDVDCTAEGLGADDKTTFVTAHLVVDGKLGRLCLGKQDKTLLEAWDLLTTLTPPDRLKDLALFVGFKPGKQAKADDPTYAFVNAIDDAGTLFQMSVNLPEAANDRQEFKLTMAHEFSHVITTAASQLDRNAVSGSCSTFRDSDGCFVPTSYIADWVTKFWGDGLAQQVDPQAEPSVDIGEPRCKANPTFLNAYAASHPEEDFAESFAAFVFAIPLPPSLQPKMDYFASHPELAVFRSRAESAKLAPLTDTFDHCGQ